MKKKLGLALGGGGARGCAHIGVIKALQEAGFSIDFVAGSSIGSIVGAALASGDIRKFEDYLAHIKWKDIVQYFDPNLPHRGLFKGEKVGHLLKKFLTHHHFKDLQIPFTAVATDLETSEEVHLNTGNVLEAVRASIALPGIFVPFKKGNQHLIDGGIINPMPADVVRDMGADIVIGVDLNYEFIQKKLKSKRRKQLKKNKIYEWLTPERPNIIDVLENSFFIMQSQITEKNIAIYRPDILIRPSLEADIFDFHKAKAMIKEGYKQMKRQIPKLKKMMGR